MRLMTWNLQHRTDAWARLREPAQQHGVDIALVQEAGRPKLDWPYRTWPKVDDLEAWHTWDRPDSVGRYWCAAITVFGEHLTPEFERRIRLAEANWNVPAISHPGQFAVASVPYGDGRLNLVSLYGIWDSRPDRESVIFAEATLHRAISDLTPLLLRDEPTIIAGDLNVCPGPDDVWSRRSQTVFDRLSTYGIEVVGPMRSDDEAELVDCMCGSAGYRHVRTITTRGRPAQLDWVLAGGLPPDAIGLTVLDFDDGASDHRPILIDLVSQRVEAKS